MIDRSFGVDVILVNFFYHKIVFTATKLPDDNFPIHTTWSEHITVLCSIQAKNWVSILCFNDFHVIPDIKKSIISSCDNRFIDENQWHKRDLEMHRCFFSFIVITVTIEVHVIVSCICISSSFIIRFILCILVFLESINISSVTCQILRQFNFQVTVA